MKAADTGRGNRSGQLYVPDSSALVALANLIVSFTKAVASAARLNEVFALRSELVDGECEKAEAKAEAVKVKMEHVTFCYPGSQEPALEDISFTAKAGETIGIIGGTGSGKTTLVNLIPRFYDVTEGKARSMDWRFRNTGQRLFENRLEWFRRRRCCFPVP